MSKSIEVFSETWRTVRDHCQARIKMHHQILETVGLSQQESEASRGAIQELREILQMAEPKLTTDIDDKRDQLGGM